MYSSLSLKQNEHSVFLIQTLSIHLITLILNLKDVYHPL